MHNEVRLLKYLKERIKVCAVSGKLRNSYRLFHGRGGDLSNCIEFKAINIDYYHPVIHIIEYFETALAENFFESLANLFDHKVCIFRQKRYLAPAVNEKVYGNEIDQVYAVEDGLRYEVGFLKNQNIGFFLDMKNGRDFVKKISKEKSVLNLFSYTCSLSVAARAGGARQVVNLDMSSQSLNQGRDNHRINGQDTKGVYFFSHNIFKSYSLIKRYGPYDLIIIDPPSDQGKSFLLSRDYPKLLKRVESWQTEKGELILCCNSPYVHSDALREMVETYLPQYDFISLLYAPDEFNAKDKEKGVKILYYKKA